MSLNSLYRFINLTMVKYLVSGYNEMWFTQVRVVIITIIITEY